MRERFTIEQDDREPDLQMEADIDHLSLKFKRSRLKVGDYIYKDIIVERKTIDDFCASILDKRIETQVENMKQSGKQCFIIIVGNLKDRTTEIHENCVIGKVVSLVVKHNMKVLWCEDDIQFVWLLRNLIEKIGDKSGEIKKIRTGD